MNWTVFFKVLAVMLGIPGALYLFTLAVFWADSRYGSIVMPIFLLLCVLSIAAICGYEAREKK